MVLHDRGHDREPEAAAAGHAIARRIQAQEALPEPCQHVVGDAGARVLDGELHAPRDVLDADRDLPAGRRVAQRIADQICQRLVDARGVGGDRRRLGAA